MKRAIKPSDVRKILLRDWDPLDVGDNPKLADEYDSYISEILRLLQGSSDAAQIDEYLKKVEADLGISLPVQRRMRAAKRLVEDI